MISLEHFHRQIHFELDKCIVWVEDALEILVECRTKYLAGKICLRMTNTKISKVRLIWWKENMRGEN